MADNVELNAGTGGAVLAADDIAGVWYPIQKLAFGAADSATLATGGSGTVDAGTLRVTLATDVALPAGTNAIGKLAANSGVDIGDVDVLSSALPTGAATSAKQDTEITALQLIDDIVYVDDADWTDDTSKHALIGGLYQATPQTITDGDVAPILLDVNGRQVVAAVQSGTWDEIGINDSGNSITVDNAGLTELAAAINASSQMDVNIAASGATVTVDGSGVTQPISHAALTELAAAIDTEVQVDVVTSALPTGASTSAKQDTMITALQLIDNLVLAEDAIHGTGDPGIQMLAVRQDVQADFGADGDYVPLSVDADGQLRVNAGSITASADSEYADDADWTDNTSVHTLVGGLFQSTPQTVTDGDVGPFNMTTNGALHVAQQGTVAVTQSGTWDEVGIHDSGNSITVDNAQLSVVGGGTEAAAMRVTIANDSTGVISIDDNGGIITVDGTVAVTHAALTELAAAIDTELQVDVVGALPAGDNNIGNVDIVSGTITTVSTVSALGEGTTGPQKAEDAAHATTDKGIYVLGVRDDSPAVHSGTDNDYESLHINDKGGLWTSPMPTDFDSTLNTRLVKKYYTNAGAVTDGIVWSPAAGTRWHVTTLVLNVSAAATVTFEDDLAGGDSAVMKFELAANSGVVIPFQTPWASGEDAADLIVTTSAGNVYITVTGYEI